MIFVHIAAYRDPECVPTIQDLFRKARHPDRIRVGLVLQSAPDEPFALSHSQVRVLRVDAAQSQGACWARALGYRLWDGEPHILQIDSHMRFAPDWDVRLLAQLGACPSPRALLTAYPPAYEPPDTLLSDQPAFLAAKGFDERGVLMQQGLLEPRPAAPKPTAFLAGGFLFGPAGWIQDAPYDPQLYFHGEEITLAARLWTHGWDLFGPTEALVWHFYDTTVRPRHWQDHAKWDERNRLALARMRQLLRMPAEAGDATADLTGFDLGSVRSLRQYQRMAGVDFRKRTIAPHALAGDFDPDRTAPAPHTLFRARLHNPGFRVVRPWAVRAVRPAAG